MAVDSSPDSIRRARSTSCAALSRGTLPISLRYMRTMSLVGARRRSTSIRTWVAASVSSPGTSMTSIPSVVRCSWICVRNSSTCSGVKSSTGTASSRSSEVTNPRSRPRATIASLTSSIPNGSRAAAGSLTGGPSRCRARPAQCTERCGRRPEMDAPSSELPVDLRELSEQLLPSRIDGRVQLLQLHPYLIAPRLEQELLEPCEHALDVVLRDVALERVDDERRDLAGELRIGSPDDRPHVAVDVAKGDEQPTIARCAEVVFAQHPHGPSVRIGVGGQEFQHLALDPLLRGRALDRLGDVGGPSAEPTLERLQDAGLRDARQVGEHPRVFAATHRIRELL